MCHNKHFLYFFSIKYEFYIKIVHLATWHDFCNKVHWSSQYWTITCCHSWLHSCHVQYNPNNRGVILQIALLPLVICYHNTFACDTEMFPSCSAAIWTLNCPVNHLDDVCWKGSDFAQQFEKHYAINESINK